MASSKFEFVMPRTIPGGYNLIMYDQFVSNVTATGYKDTGLVQNVAMIKDGARWRVQSLQQVDTISQILYFVDIQQQEQQLYASNDASKIRKEQYVGILGYSVFGYIIDMQNTSIALNMVQPWKAFCTLAPSLGGTISSAMAANYYELADSQLVFYNSDSVTIQQMKCCQVSAVELYIVVYNELANVNMSLIAETSLRAMNIATNYMQAPAFTHFSVMMEILQPITPDNHLYGFSMEHLNSVTINVSPALALYNGAQKSDILRAQYNLVHHMMHAWIPKRCHGSYYMPFNWELPMLFDSIWFSEGFVQYASLVAICNTMPEQEAQAYFASIMEQRFNSTLRDAPQMIRNMDLFYLSSVASTMYAVDFRTGSNTFSRGAMMAYEMDMRLRTQHSSMQDALNQMVQYSLKDPHAWDLQRLPDIIYYWTGVNVIDIFAKWERPL